MAENSSGPRKIVTRAKVIESYPVKTDEVTIEVNIIDDEKAFVRSYYLNFPEYGAGTVALLTNLKTSILSEISLRAERMMESKFVERTKDKFKLRAEQLLERNVPEMPDETKNLLIGILLNEMLGLGKIEILLSDPNLEEIVVNYSKEPVWVYHKKYGWLKTNIFLESEGEIENYASIIARRIGKQITILNPLLDAHLITGDRANATLFPISSRGNTITIRRFRRDPWTVTDFLENKTVSKEIMALIWICMEYELNIIVSGGTASGKTSFMNICMPFFQPNHRILSIEDTRELMLPKFLHWVPLTTREPNPEGKGGVSMLDLLVNSLRMRPDRIIVGEIRRQREAEVMFEAMHTGHSVYTTFHANTADETVRRFINPPVNVPATMMEAVHLNVVMFRNRRLGVRRILQVAELIPERRGKEESIKTNILYRWRGSDDKIVQHSDSIRLIDELSLHTGLSRSEIMGDIRQKESILEWMGKFNIRSVTDVGKVMAQYYRDSEELLKHVKKNEKMEELKAMGEDGKPKEAENA
ncbi:MAG: type II/IV secretion system ATPase subunit [Candidatus Diapherotrites archaeon]|uniref:Type II/IV secretion system ATPase subunit n=1 Tax=Candidatus Iainarchaeum sp. TaxID=3101447 RepID=A0A939C6U8_9ARCH|nr:type II/IV secretion system ATPase subunit [Candidatus Diapherotrites archaeon]